MIDRLLERKFVRVLGKKYLYVGGLVSYYFLKYFGYVAVRTVGFLDRLVAGDDEVVDISNMDKEDFLR